MTIAEIVYEKLKSAPPAIARGVLDFLEFLEARARRSPGKQPKSFDELIGTLKDSKSFQGDAVEVQRKLRAEWDR